MRRLILLTSAILLSAFIMVVGIFYARPPEPEPAAGIGLVAGTAPTATLEGALEEALALPRQGVNQRLRQHPYFPLRGGHALAACADCHTGGTYQGLASECVTCHLADDAHDGQNGLDCESCHKVSTWENAVFDHSRIGRRDCAECHTSPADHFPGPCAACHLDTNSFSNVSFDHSQVANQDCAACHAPPPNHYGPPCSVCHLDTTNFRNVSFDHSRVAGQDCAACHTPPPNHYGTPCSACHLDTANFRNVRFDHAFAGGQDCAACHAPPPNHFPGACRDCHQDTGNWRNATFNHTFPLNHGGANGQCTTCHAGNSPPAYTCFSCHNQGEMLEEHAEEGITDISNCVRCHADGREPDD
jgi:hypothetical protein